MSPLAQRLLEIGLPGQTPSPSPEGQGSSAVDIAILHDGSFDGDSQFYAGGSVSPTGGIFAYNGQSLEELKEEYRAALTEDGWDDEEGIAEMVNAVQGAWVLNAAGAQTLNDMIDSAGEIGNDSATYRLNRQAKTMAARLAVKQLQPDPSHTDVDPRTGGNPPDLGYMGRGERPV